MVMTKTKRVAEQVVQVIPLLMRNAGADLRCHGAGLAPAQFALLGMLSNGTFNLSELAERQSVTLATISNSVGTLIERGLVERVPAAGDRRIVQVRITLIGREVLENVHAHMEERVSAAISGLNSQELDDLDAGLTVLHKMLMGMITTKRPAAGAQPCGDRSGDKETV